MKIKSYYAKTTAAAIEQARRELGAEAVIVQSRRAAEEHRHLGEHEVVVALLDGEQEPAAKAAPPEPAPARLTAEMAELRRQLEMMRRTISSNLLAAPRWPAADAGLAEAFSALVAEEVDPDLARDIVDSAAAPAHSLRAELEGRIRSHPAPGLEGGKALALVGPPGSGKTTTLVKLAITRGLARRRPVELLSIDNYRVGGAAQLQHYAAILGAGFRAVETVGALAQALEACRAKSLVLIDTPGYGSRELDWAAEPAAFLAARTDIDTHLVLTASMKSADLGRVAEQYEIFRPANLLFTRLDETESIGSLYSLAARTGKPLSFFGTGQQIPEDLEPVEAARVVDRLLSRVPLARAA